MDKFSYISLIAYPKISNFHEFTEMVILIIYKK